MSADLGALTPPPPQSPLPPLGEGEGGGRGGIREELEQIYSNSDAAYTGQYAIYKQAKAQGLSGITLKKVKAFLNTKTGWIQQKKSPKKFRRAKVVATNINDLWEADITYLTHRKMSRKNRGWKYVLTCIDVLSKKAYVRYLKKKSGPAVLEAFRNLLESVTPQCPKNLRTDRGTEFSNSQFRALCKEFNINHYWAGNIVKACVVERFNRTLKEMLFEAMNDRGSMQWLDNDLLTNLVMQYNNRPHSTTSLAPNRVRSSDVPLLLAKIYGVDWSKQASSARFRLLLRDTVFVAKSALSGFNKSAFVRGYEDVFSSEVFTVVERIASRPPRYRLKDREGRLVSGSKTARTGNPNSFVCELSPPLSNISQLTVQSVTVVGVAKKHPIALSLDVSEDVLTRDVQLRKVVAVFRGDLTSPRHVSLSGNKLSRIGVRLARAADPKKPAFEEHELSSDALQVIIELSALPFLPRNQSSVKIDARHFSSKILLAPNGVGAVCNFTSDSIDC